MGDRYIIVAKFPGFMHAVFQGSKVEKESERGCVLICTAMLDDLLGELLRSRFIADGHLSQGDIDFLLTKGPVPPLRPFAMRIIYAHAFGLINHKTRKALDAIREVRNRCGHFSGEFAIDLAEIKPALDMVADHVLFRRMGAQF